MRPWTYDAAWGGRETWYHTDQPASLSAEQIAQETAEKGGPMAHGYDRLYCQGFVNLLRTTEGTGGNVVVPKSHKHWERLGRMEEDEGTLILQSACQATAGSWR